MNIPNQKKFASILSLVFLGMPIVMSGAAIPNVLGIPCGVSGGGAADTPCEFKHLILLADNIIKFLLFAVTIPLTVLCFMWVGANLIFKQDKEGEWTKATEGFYSIAQGFLIILGTYVVLSYVIYSFLNTEKEFFVFLVKP